MRTLRSSLPALAAVALSAAAATAQRPAAAPDHARPNVPVAAAGDADRRPVAIYRFNAPRSTGLPAWVVVADSAGTLVATFQLPGGRDPQPMEVTLMETDIVLQGETPAGVLTMRLFRQNEPDAPARGLDGRWWLGETQGVLRGRPAR